MQNSSNSFWATVIIVQLFVLIMYLSKATVQNFVNASWILIFTLQKESVSKELLNSFLVSLNVEMFR